MGDWRFFPSEGQNYMIYLPNAITMWRVVCYVKLKTFLLIYVDISSTNRLPQLGIREKTRILNVALSCNDVALPMQNQFSFQRIALSLSPQWQNRSLSSPVLYIYPTSTWTCPYLWPESTKTPGQTLNRIILLHRIALRYIMLNSNWLWKQDYNNGCLFND